MIQLGHALRKPAFRWERIGKALIGLAALCGARSSGFPCHHTCMNRCAVDYLIENSASSHGRKSPWPELALHVDQKRPHAGGSRGRAGNVGRAK